MDGTWITGAVTVGLWLAVTCAIFVATALGLRGPERRRLRIAVFVLAPIVVFGVLLARKAQTGRTVIHGLSLEGDHLVVQRPLPLGAARIPVSAIEKVEGYCAARKRRGHYCRIRVVAAGRAFESPRSRSDDAPVRYPAIAEEIRARAVRRAAPP